MRCPLQGSFKSRAGVTAQVTPCKLTPGRDITCQLEGTSPKEPMSSLASQNTPEAFKDFWKLDIAPSSCWNRCAVQQSLRVRSQGTETSTNSHFQELVCEPVMLTSFFSFSCHLSLEACKAPLNLRPGQAEEVGLFC